MKVCSLRRLLKYTLLISLTSFVTTVVFHLVRKTNHVHPRSIRDDDSSYVDSDGGEKIDWHDWKLIVFEEKRKGPGEHGEVATLPPDHSQKKYNDLYGTNGYNALMSDYISINRSLPDIRHPDCKYKKYRSVLPDVSIVVPFHNEHWSTLLRTVYSVLNRSPPKLIKEIILVDDSSTKAHCKKPLDKYVEQNLPKVKVIHLEKRQGLIRARIAGAKAAKGQVLVFLDSHTEANVNWLPPLLDPIAEDYKTCVCPFIDVIDFETFEYKPQDDGARGAFSWEFFYKRLPLLPEDRLDPTKPFKSPVMAGGLFAISVRFFWELGGYDPGLDIWGGEQYELSFKIWQCGGQMVDAPCSRVGHIYRKFAPFPNPQIGDFVGRNYRRVAEVWMDEYAEYLYTRRPEWRKIYPGDLTEQRKIRDKLQCKPFKWFMEKVAFDLTKHYPLIEPPDYGSGEIKPLGNQDWCIIANKRNQSVELAKCSDSAHSDSESSLFKIFLLSWHKDIQVKNTGLCLDVSNYGAKVPVGLYACHFDQGNQLWRYDIITNQIIFGHSMRCLDHDIAEKSVFLTECNSTLETQKWSISEIDEEAIKKWNETIPL